MKRQNFWCWWIYRPRNEELNSVNELYLDIDSEWHHPENDKELKDYIKECKRYNVIPYIIVNCFATAQNEALSISEIAQQAKDKVDYVLDVAKAHPVLDYIRSSGSRKVPKQHIYDVIDYTVERDPIAKSSIMSMWKAWNFDQNYNEFYKRITICPMVYGTGIMTRFWLVVHKLLFPNCLPCIRAWDTTKNEFDTQVKLIKDNNYTVWKFNDWAILHGLRNKK